MWRVLPSLADIDSREFVGYCPRLQHLTFRAQQGNKLLTYNTWHLFEDWRRWLANHLCLQQDGCMHL